MSVKVSIIVPVYNSAKTLRRCADSILNQDFTDYELFLVDDGSTDDSGAICDEYAALDITASMSFTKITAVYLIQEIQLLIWLTENTYNF